MQEIWKDVLGYEGSYKVSNLGNVISIDRYVYYQKRKDKVEGKFVKGSVLVKRKSFGKYLSVNLSKPGHGKKSFFVHRLVAKAFIPNPNNFEQVNHKDGNIYNNSVDNLEWVTMSQNVRHAYETGLNYGLRDELSPHKRAVLQFDKDGNFIRRWCSAATAARELNCHKEGIYLVCRRKNKTHYGYIWRYEDE